MSEQVDITAPAVLVERSWNAFRLPEEQREQVPGYLGDMAALKDLDAIIRFGARMEEIALNVELGADMAIDTEREIREIPGEDEP